MNKPLIRPQADHKARFTTAEFLRMAAAGAFEDMKVELVEGELERMNPPMNSHSAKQSRLLIRLAAMIDETMIRGEIGIALGDHTVRACDAAILRVQVQEDRLLRPEEILLVIEIAETTIARDMGAKRIDYARAAIPHYWVVDGERAVVHIYADPVGGEYADVRSIRFGEPMPVPGVGGTIILD